MITEKGREFLEKWRELLKLLTPEDGLEKFSVVSKPALRFGKIRARR